MNETLIKQVNAKNFLKVFVNSAIRLFPYMMRGKELAIDI